MKTFICSALFLGSNAQRGPSEMVQAEILANPGSDRRYVQLVDMMEHYNNQFDERKFWAYGCQCLILGDRPMSDPGHGRPIDALDSVCKDYKDCLKCARMNHGSSCIGEFYKYKFGFNSKGDVYCRNRPSKGPEDACKRSLCECDAAFARAHPKVKHVFNEDYHLFWSTIGWEPKDPENCKRGHGINDPQCCGTPLTPYQIYNAHPMAPNPKQCCNGEVRESCD